MEPDDLHGTLAHLEHDLWMRGADFYRETLAPECRMVFPGVGPMDREAAIEGIASGQRWEEVAMSEIEVTRIAPATALVTYEVKAARDGDDEAYHVYAASVYTRVDGDWKLAFHQQTMAE